MSLTEPSPSFRISQGMGDSSGTDAEREEEEDDDEEVRARAIGRRVGEWIPPVVGMRPIPNVAGSSRCDVEAKGDSASVVAGNAV